MANTKNALLRTKIIDRCLSDKRRKYSTQDLMNECNRALSAKGMTEVTSLNTIREDMVAIQEHWMVEIKTIVSGRNKFYAYADPAFSIYKAAVTRKQREKFAKAMQLLTQIEEDLFS